MSVQDGNISITVAINRGQVHVKCDPVPDWSRDELSSMCPIFAGFRTDGDLE